MLGCASVSSQILSYLANNTLIAKKSSTECLESVLPVAIAAAVVVMNALNYPVNAYVKSSWVYSGGNMSNP